MAYKKIEDSRAYGRNWYKENKDRRVKQIRAYQAKQINKLRKYKIEHGCSVCGYDKCAEALDFHHRDAKDKEMSISKMKGYSFETTLREIKKCKVLCKNCHAEGHAKR